LAIFASPLLYVSLCISAGSLVMAFKKVHPIVIICISAAIGIATGYIFEF